MKSMNLAAALITLGLVGAPVVTLSQEHNQQKHETQRPQPQDDSTKMSEMMGKPTFEQSVDGIHIQLWLVTQEEHKEMMSERMSARPDKDGSGGKDSAHHEKMDSKMMCGGMSARSDAAVQNAEKRDKTGTGGKQGHDMMGMMHEHGKSGKQSDAMEEGMMESMMAGTHHVMVVILDEENMKEIENAEVELQVTSPSGQTSTLELMSMMNHSCGGLSFEEKGTYGISANVEVQNKTRRAQFEYEVK